MDDQPPRSATPGPSTSRHGFPARLFWAFWGLPVGRVGWIGARTLPLAASWLYAIAATELALRADDELLDVGCGAGTFLADRAEIAGYVAGIDASPIQVAIARRRLRQRLESGTAQIVLGDAAALPWPDGRFSAVASLNCLKFLADPEAALREMHRVLRPGGRVLHVTDGPARGSAAARGVDSLGIRRWSTDDSRRMMERAGFVEVSVAQLPVWQLRLQIVHGVRPDEAASTSAELVGGTDS